jgi:hypothetical protein
MRVIHYVHRIHVLKLVTITMKVIIIFSILFLLSTESFSQWVQTSGPSGGGVSDFAFINDTIFASSFDLGNGVYTSTDNGTTWHESGLQGTMLNHITARGNTLLTSSTQNSYNETDTIYRSSDKGATWQSVLTVPNINGVVSICPYQQNMWIISSMGMDGKFFISTNDGVSWDSFQPAWEYSEAIPVVAFGNFLIAGVNIGGIPYIQLSGENTPTFWPVQIRIDSLSQISCATVAGNTIWFAGTGGVIYSNDGGLSWGHPMDSGFENKRIENITSLAASGDHLLAVTSLNNMYYSWNKGDNWTKISGNGLPANASFLFCVAQWNNTYFLGSSSGIVQSQDYGVNWQYSTSGLRCTDLKALASYQNTIYAATEKGVTYSTDQGTTWSDAKDTIQLADVNINGFFTQGNDFFAYGTGVYSWNGAWVAMDNNIVTAFTVGGNGRLFETRNGTDPIVDTCKIFISDKGADWQMTLSFANSIDSEFNFLPNCLSANGSVILAANRAVAFQTFTNSYFISRSTDNGMNWSTTSLPYSPTFITLADGVFYMGTNENGLFQSTNNGITWDPIGFNSKSGVNSFLKVNGWLFVSVTGNGNATDGIYRFGNDGKGWNYADGTTANIIGPLTNDASYLYSGTPSVWKRPLSQLSVDEKNPANSTFSLYPNPAENVVKIHTRTTIVNGTIIMYDQKGMAVLRQPVSFSDESQDVSLSLAGLSEAMYYIRLLDKAGNEIANSQFVILHK